MAPQWVLTAGHCAVDENGVALAPEPYRVSVGVVRQDTLGATALDREPTVRPLPVLQHSTLQGDAALLKLTAVGTGTCGDDPPRHSRSIGAVRGRTAGDGDGLGRYIPAPDATASTVLQMGTVTVQSNATCAAGSFGEPFYPGYDLCASAPGFNPSTCNGDSGGPLVENTPAGPVEIGIVSYGFGTVQRRSPGFYTRTSSIQSWVASVIAATPLRLHSRRRSQLRPSPPR